MSEYHATFNEKDEDGTIINKIDLTTEYDFGEDLQTSIELFGEKVVHSAFCQQSVVKLQALMRSTAKAGKDVAEAVANWKPGVTRVRGKSAQDKVLEAYAAMSEDEQAALIAKLQDQAEE